MLQYANPLFKICYTSSEYITNALLRLRGQKYDLFLKNANLKAKKINMMENIGGNKAKGLVFH